MLLTATLLSLSVNAQVLVDRTMAIVSDGIRNELITLSDVRWQLALQPGTSLEPISQEDVEAALRLVIEQRIFALEADRLPRNPPTEKEVQDEIAALLRAFRSTAEFERRLRLVGFASIRDPNFERLIAQRLSIEKYIDFRFRAFVVITREEEEQYYEEVFLPEFRRANPGRVVPALDAVRQEINSRLTEERVTLSLDSFIDDARTRIEVTIFEKNP